MFKVITGEKGELKPSCTVKMGHDVDVFEDFVVVGMPKNEDAVMLHYADAITLGKAFRLVGEAFKENYNGLSKEEQEIVDSVLQTVEVDDNE